MTRCLRTFAQNCVYIYIVVYPVRMGWEVISIQDGGRMLTSSITRACVRARLRKESLESSKGV